MLKFKILLTLTFILLLNSCSKNVEDVKFIKETSQNEEIISAYSKGMSLIERHQLVYKAVDEYMHVEIHALTMKTLTPEEYKQCIEIGIDGCNQVYEIQKKALQDKFFASGEKQ